MLIGNGHTGEMHNKVSGSQGRGNYPTGRRRFSEGSCTGGEQQKFIRDGKKEIYIRKVGEVTTQAGALEAPAIR